MFINETAIKACLERNVKSCQLVPILLQESILEDEAPEKVLPAEVLQKIFPQVCFRCLGLRAKDDRWYKESETSEG